MFVRAAAGCLSAIEMQLLYELIPRGSNSCAGFFEKHCAKKSPLASSGGGTASAVTEGFNPRRHGRIVRAAKGCLSAFLHGGLFWFIPRAMGAAGDFSDEHRAYQSLPLKQGEVARL